MKDGDQNDHPAPAREGVGELRDALVIARDSCHEVVTNGEWSKDGESWTISKEVYAMAQDGDDEAQSALAGDGLAEGPVHERGACNPPSATPPPAREGVGIEKLVDEFDSATMAYGNLDCDKTDTPDGKAKLERYEKARLALIAAYNTPPRGRVVVDEVLEVQCTGMNWNAAEPKGKPYKVRISGFAEQPLPLKHGQAVRVLVTQEGRDE